jgi:Na+/H+ antiporter NhaA
MLTLQGSKKPLKLEAFYIGLAIIQDFYVIGFEGDCPI